VIYAEAADKAARFVMDCNQMGIPLVFLQDVVGFMVGKDAEHSGIIRSGAKLVNALSNAVVPKITIIVGGSFGAGNYAMCGKAYDPRFIFGWPNAKYAVMGAAQASGVPRAGGHPLRRRARLGGCRPPAARDAGHAAAGVRPGHSAGGQGVVPHRRAASLSPGRRRSFHVHTSRAFRQCRCRHHPGHAQSSREAQRAFRGAGAGAARGVDGG
jgi:hypothetical protein